MIKRTVISLRQSSPGDKNNFPILSIILMCQDFIRSNRWFLSKNPAVAAFARLRGGEVNKELSTTPLTVFHRHDLVFCSEPITSLIIICLDKGRDEWFDTRCLIFSISTVPLVCTGKKADHFTFPFLKQLFPWFDVVSLLSWN